MSSSARATQALPSAVRRQSRFWIAALFDSTRPLASLVPGTLAAVPAIARGAITRHALAAGFAMLALAMCGFVVNDLADYRKDRAAGVRRPIAAGMLSRAEATWFAAALLLLACAFAAAAPSGHAVFALTAAALLLYSAVAHRWPLAKDAYIAILCCLPLHYGALTARAAFPWYCYALLAGFIFGREILMDAVELRGDCQAGMRTLAAYFGARRAARAGLALMCAASAALLLVVHGSLATLAAGAMLVSLACGFAWPGLALACRIELSRISMVLGALAVAWGG